MKIAILHLSDFHVNAGERFIKEKINKFLESLNIIGNVDEYVIVFSGDLANSGQINEYKSSRNIIGRIISGIKEKHNNKFIDLLMIPGNHDLTLTVESRKGSDIQEAYNNNSIESFVQSEIKLLDNYYLYSHANARIPHDKIVDRRFCTYNDEYKIQFNLINTSLFSTLKPDDKELHYFPEGKMQLLKKQDTADLCITVMHHSCEWFNWNYKTDLEKTIINNSEMLFTGHDHYGSSKKVSIDNSMDTWLSCAGSMKFSDLNHQDSFNTILIDTNSNTFSGYIFSWNPLEKIYVHNTVVDSKPLQSRTSRLTPLPSYIKELKEDTFNINEDFTKYFVFPKLMCSQQNEFGKYLSILKSEELLKFIEDKKRILICGSSNSGKSTLLKHLYYSVTSDKTPLFLSIDSTTKFKPQKLIKQLFEEQYGDNPILYERYQQLNKENKIIIIDGWDRISTSKIKEHLFAILNENFDCIICSINNTQKDVVDAVKDEINEDYSFHELSIKPFFAEKRNQLVRNICTLNSSYNDEDINRVNKLIDSLVHNNNNLFSLNPGFIIKYTNYFIKDSSYDYPKGEAVFSKIFEHGIQSLIIDSVRKSEVDEIITTFEEIAGYIYNSHNDILGIGEFKYVVEQYNEDYNVQINTSHVLKVGLQTKLLRQADDLSIYFSNKNYLAYFIAKYLFRKYQSEGDYSSINRALRNICFGINSDIILFISYLSSSTRTLMAISEHAADLLSLWPDLSFENDNISFLKKTELKEINPPTKSDENKVKEVKEKAEERRYMGETIEAKGLFNYDENDIDKYQFRLVRAIKYTEMICKSLPAFNNVLKRSQKDSLIESIYSYPHKIAFALLEPIEKKLDKICEELLKLADEIRAEKKPGKPYVKDDIIEMINEQARSIVLGIYNHFAELCTSSKTVNILCEKEIIGINQRLQKLIIKENASDTDAFLKEAEIMLKTVKDKYVKDMIRIIVKKHLLCNTDLPRNKRQQIIDKIFGESARKDFLLASNNF